MITPTAEPTAERADPRPSLLIADDDQLVRAVLSTQLAADFRVIGPAKDATEAIQLAKDHQPDAALIDVEMPGGGAMEAVPRIAACSPGTRQVLISGDERHGLVVELLSAGAIAYIEKGLAGASIAKTLAAALEVTPTEA